MILLLLRGYAPGGAACCKPYEGFYYAAIEFAPHNVDDRALLLAGHEEASADCQNRIHEKQSK